MMDTVYKLSERNCVELVIKLIDTGRLQLIFTKNGREYLTHKQLSEEIEDEVLAHGGAFCVSKFDVCVCSNHKSSGFLNT